MTVLSLTADPGVDRCNSNSESLEIKDVLEIFKHDDHYSEKKQIK